jgi:probable F420-dependent oxidoreductase
MRYGIGAPIVVTPRNPPAWEMEGGIAELSQIAVAADQLGYDYITCSEHVAAPTSVENARGVTFWDPLALFGYFAAKTERLRFATHVLVLGYHHPLAIAKRYGTLDAVCGGRLILGVGVGTLKEEFDLLGAPFEDRGPRADEAIRALRASLSQRQPKFHGQYWRYDDMVVRPHAVQAKVPIWVGGTSKRSLRRAVELADGWTPVFLAHDALKEMLASFDIPKGFDIVLPADGIDPKGDPDGTRRMVDALGALGATHVTVKLAVDSLAEYLRQMEAFHRLVEMGAA